MFPLVSFQCIKLGPNTQLMNGPRKAKSEPAFLHCVGTGRLRLVYDEGRSIFSNSNCTMLYNLRTASKYLTYKLNSTKIIFTL